MKKAAAGMMAAEATLGLPREMVNLREISDSIWPQQAPTVGVDWGVAVGSSLIQGMGIGIAAGEGIRLTRGSTLNYPKIEWDSVTASKIESQPTPKMQACPRCGQEPCLMAILTEQEPHSMSLFRVHCLKCHTCSTSYAKPITAIEMWNAIQYAKPEPAKPKRESKKFKLEAQQPSIKLE